MLGVIVPGSLRIQNNEFVCGIRRTCKQNHLRKTQVILLYLARPGRLRAER